jgi:hypothetical protein
MQSLSTAYTVYYNLRHKRHGHLLDGRYKSKLVDGDKYLLALTRYVHLNPVRIATLKGRQIKEKIRYLRQYQGNRGLQGVLPKRRCFVPTSQRVGTQHDSFKNSKKQRDCHSEPATASEESLASARAGSSF